MRFGAFWDRVACSPAAVPAAATVLEPVQHAPLNAEDLADPESALQACLLPEHHVAPFEAMVALAAQDAEEETVAEAELPAGDAEVQAGAPEDAEAGAHDTAAPVATAGAAVQVAAAAAAAGGSPRAVGIPCTYRMTVQDQVEILQCHGAVLDLAPALLRRLRPRLSA